MSIAAFTAVVLAIVVAFVWTFNWVLRMIDRAMWNMTREDWAAPGHEPRDSGVEPIGERGD